MAMRKAAQIKDRQLTPLSCWTPPNILITPSISCSSLLAQYCILQETERKRGGERERKKKSQSPAMQQISQVMKGQQGSQHLGLCSLRRSCSTGTGSTESTWLLRARAGGRCKLRAPKQFTHKATQREKGRRLTRETATFFFPLLISAVVVAN